jgi:hypothetical protein
MRTAFLTPGAEKRQAPRMPVDWDLRVRVTGEDGFIPAKAVNVSKGGLAVSLDRSLERDAVAKLEFRPGKDMDDVHAFAYVAWSRLDADHPAAGLRFFGISEADEDRLAGLVEQWLLHRRAAVKH